MTRFEKFLPWIFFLIFACLLMLDSGVWHPGFSFLDEGLGSVANVQLWREGRSLPFELFKGCLHRDLAALAIGIFGPSLEVWRAFTLLALGLECLLLTVLAKRWGNSRAGIFAACLNLCCALTFLRARSLLSYSILPLELLTLIWLLPYACKRIPAFFWGCAAAGLLLDYEGWLFSLPVLALVWACEKKQARPPLAWIALGFFLSLLALLVHFWQPLHSHWLLRSRSLPTGSAAILSALGLSLRSFFWGGNTFGYMGIFGHSVYPFWMLPALMVGLVLAWREKRWWLAWAALGLLPMGFIGTAAEPNRLMVAWPALCLLGGLGLTLIPEKLTPWIAFCLLLGAGVEARAYVLSMQMEYRSYYGNSADLLRCAREAKAVYPAGMKLISELDYETSAAERFIWEGYGPGKSETDEWALIPWDYAINVDASWGHVVKEAPGFILLEPSSKASMRLRQIEAELLRLRRDLPRFDLLSRRQKLIDYLAANPQADPWIRTSVMEGALGMSFMIGDLPKSLLESVLKEKLCSSSAYVWIADKARTADPDFARYLYTRALRKDPRRQDLKEMLIRLSQKGVVN